MVVIALIAFLSAFIMPNFRGLLGRSERKEFVTKLNQLMAFAWRNAIETNMMHMVYFDLKEKSVRVSKISPQDTGKESTGQPISTALPQSAAAMKIPKAIEIKQFIIEGVDELASREASKARLWFFVVPNGMTQEITINFVDTNEKTRGSRSRRIGLVLNPFTAQFREYNEFQK